MNLAAGVGFTLPNLRFSSPPPASSSSPSSPAQRVGVNGARVVAVTWARAALATLLPLSLSLLGACDDDDPPTCLIKTTRALPAGALGGAANVRIEPVGGNFLMTGWNETRAEMRAGLVDSAGLLGPELVVTLPEPPAAGPWSAVVAKQAPADQLLVVYGVADPTGAPGAIALRFVAIIAGVPASAPSPLLDPEGHPVVLPAPPPPGTVTMGTSPSGRMALFVAAPSPTTSPIAFLLGPDGTSQSLPSALPIPGGATTCLSLLPGQLSFAVSRVVPSVASNVRPRWLFAELSDQGVIGESFSFDILSNDSKCPVISPTPHGYVAAWQSPVGTYFAEILKAPEGLSLNAGLLKGAVRFGGANLQPPLACIASAGQDIHITFASQPPAVERFTRFGLPAGGTLTLPSAGQVGPVTAWPRNGSTFLTYLEDNSAGAGSAPVRQWLEVICPSATPDAGPLDAAVPDAGTPDAGID